jgi:hypothetical protein
MGRLVFCHYPPTTRDASIAGEPSPPAGSLAGLPGWSWALSRQVKGAQLPRRTPPPAEEESVIRLSLRPIPRRGLAVFRIDRRTYKQPWVSVFLDRSTTPVPEAIFTEWATALEGVLEDTVTRKTGIQYELPNLVNGPRLLERKED